MPISRDHAFARGMVSRKAAAKIGIHGPRTGPDYRMTEFDRREKDEAGGATGKRGSSMTPANSINFKARQKLGSPATASGKVSAGGQAKGSWQPGRGAINDVPGQGKKFPHGGKVTKQKRQIGVSGGGDANDGGDGKNYYGGGMK